MVKERKFWGGMMPVSKIGKDTSGNSISDEEPASKASPPVAPAHGAGKPGTVRAPQWKGLPPGEESVE